HWGELGAGTWTLTVADRGAGAPGGTLDGWSLKVYGTNAPPDVAASGHVTLAGGAPLAGVTLTFARQGGGAAPAPVQTDADGAWSQHGFVATGGSKGTPRR